MEHLAENMYNSRFHIMKIDVLNRSLEDIRTFIFHKTEKAAKEAIEGLEVWEAQDNFPTKYCTAKGKDAWNVITGIWIIMIESYIAVLLFIMRQILIVRIFRNQKKRKQSSTENMECKAGLN